ncbi:MAG: DUF3822 family protein [Chitinophagales bacterium]
MQLAAHLKNSFQAEGDYSQVSEAPEVVVMQLGENVFRYAIWNAGEESPVFIGTYHFSPGLPDQEQEKELRAIFMKDGLLHRTYSNALLVWQTPFEIQPETADAIPNVPGVHMQHCHEQQAVLFYETPEYLKRLFAEHFPHIKLFHSGAVLINSYNKTPKDPSALLVHVNNGSIEVVVVSDKGLQLYNRYEFRSVNDFMYFVLLAATETRLDRNQTTLYLTGEIEEDAAVSRQCRMYFKNVIFLHTGDGSHQGHRYYLLNNAKLCAS